VLAVFHLNNKDAKHELNVNHNKGTLPLCSEPKYQSNVGQDAHVLLTARITLQKVDIMRCTLKVLLVLAGGLEQQRTTLLSDATVLTPTF